MQSIYRINETSNRRQRLKGLCLIAYFATTNEIQFSEVVIHSRELGLKIGNRNKNDTIQTFQFKKKIT